MTRPALTLRDLRVLLSISAAKAGPNEDAVAVRATWEQTFNSGDADKIAALYTKDAMMFGSTAHLFTGTDGVRTYFSKLPAAIKVKMGDRRSRTVPISCSARALPILRSRTAPCCPTD